MAAPNELTQKEMEVLALSYRCFIQEPVIDYEKVAKLAGYANHRSVSNLFGKIRSKLNAVADDKAGPDESPKVKGTPRKRKGAVPTDGDDAASPAKRPRVKKGSAGAEAMETDENDDEN